MESLNPRTHVFLVHGVGLPSEDLFGCELTQKLLQLGVSENRIIQINWHGVVDLPYLDVQTSGKPFRLTNFRQIAGLIRGVIGTATLPGPRNFWLSRLAYFLLHCAMIFAPLIMLWSIVLIARGQSLSSTNRLVRSLVEPVIKIGALLLGPALERFSWMPLAYYRVLGILALALLLVHIAENGRQGALAGVRKCAVCLAWPLVYTLSLCASWVGAVYAAVYVSILTADLPVWHSDQVAVTPGGVIVAGGSDMLMALSALLDIVLAIGAALTVLIVAQLLMWFFKVSADVMRFAGDPDYAKALIDHLKAQINNAGLKAGDNVVVVGHSLGSAICLNCLLDRPVFFSRDARIFFVTLGSPITRMLARFFPGIMPTADSAANQLRAWYRDFRWINVYRPFDPIGAALFSQAKPPFTCDMSTKQYTKVLLAAHTEYWDDDVVIKAVYSAIVDSRASEQVSNQPTDCDYRHDKAAQKAPLPLRVSQSLGSSVWFRVTVALGFATLVALNMTFLIRDEMKASNTPRLEKSSVVTDDAWLYRWIETNPAARPEGGSLSYIPLDFYIVEFTPVGAAKPIASYVDPFAVRGRLDRRFETEGEAVTIKQRGHLFDTAATRIRARVRYLPTDPTVFDFPTLRPKSSSDTYIYRFAFTYYAALASVGLTVPLLLWLVPLYFGIHPKVPFSASFQ